MSSFKKVAFTVYAVADMKRARAFYEGKLGFKPGDDFNGTWQEYDLGGTTFAIASSISEWVKPGTQQGVSFEVTDLPRLVQELKAKQVTFTPVGPGDILESPVCHMAFVQDPDGNSVGLHQVKD